VNDLHFVLRAVDLLAARGIRSWVFGSWAEELRGLCPPCEHERLELLYPARDWSRVDALQLDWVEAQERPWRRAFVLDGTLVVLFLAERDEQGWHTQLERRRHDWPGDVFATSGTVSVVSGAALAGYRSTQQRAA
jgi:hypothetical protein